MIQQISIRLPEELYKAIKDKSKQMGISVNAYIVQRLWEERR